MANDLHYDGSISTSSAGVRTLNDLITPANSPTLTTGQMLNFGGVSTDNISTGLDLSGPQQQTICATIQGYDATSTSVIAGQAYSATSGRGTISLVVTSALSGQVKATFERAGYTDFDVVSTLTESTQTHTYHATLNASTGYIYLYRDGVLDNSGYFADLIFDTPTYTVALFGVGAGSTNTTPLNFANGNISNVKFWNTALTSTEVATDFGNAENSVLSSVQSANLALHLPLSEGTGSTVHERVSDTSISIAHSSPSTSWSAGASKNVGIQLLGVYQNASNQITALADTMDFSEGQSVSTGKTLSTPYSIEEVVTVGATTTHYILTNNGTTQYLYTNSVSGSGSPASSPVTLNSTGVANPTTIDSRKFFKTYTTALSQAEVDDLYDLYLGNVTVSDTGNTGTFTANSVSVVGGSLAVDTGNTGTFTALDVTVSTVASITVVDTGDTGTFTALDPTVTAIINIAISDTGNTATFTANTPTVTAVLAYIVEYLLTDPLTTAGLYSYTPNTGAYPATDGKLIVLSDESPWNPTSGGAEYPENGTIDLSGGHAIDTQILFSSLEEWAYPQVYNIDGAGNYDAIVLHYHGDGTADVYRADQDTAFTLASADTGLLYTPPTNTYKVEEIPRVPAIPVGVFSGISNLSDPSPVTITLTFNAFIDPATFTEADITQGSEVNGTISDLTQTSNPLVWTFVFTPYTMIIDATNTFTLGVGFTDLWGNAPTAPVVSSNFEINSGINSTVLTSSVNDVSVSVRVAIADTGNAGTLSINAFTVDEGPRNVFPFSTLARFRALSCRVYIDGVYVPTVDPVDSNYLLKIIRVIENET